MSLGAADLGFSQEQIAYAMANLEQFTDDELMEIESFVEELEQRTADTLCRDDLIEFAKHMEEGYLVGRHHRILADMLMALERGEKDRICVNIPPRHGKSMLVSTMNVAWYLGRNPSHKVMMVSHTTDLAVDFGRKVRNIVASAAYKQIFPDVSLAIDSKSAGRWNTNRGGEFFACLQPDTRIKTLAGLVRADAVRLGDEVYAPGGYVEVLAIMESTHTATVTINRTLSCSTEHPIWVFGRGWVDAEEVCIGDVLCVESFWDILKTHTRELYHGTFRSPNVQTIQGYALAVLSCGKSQLPRLWRAWCNSVQPMACDRELCSGHGGATHPPTHSRSDRQRWAVPSRELPVGNENRTEQEQTNKPAYNRARADADVVSVGRGAWHHTRGYPPQSEEGDDTSGSGAGPQATHEEVQRARDTASFGWVRRNAARLFAGCIKNNANPKCGPEGYIESITEAAQVVQGLLLGVRRVARVTVEEHAPRTFVNYTVAGGNRFFADGILTHNCGIGSSIAGRGAHLLVIDDPHSEQDVINGNFGAFAKAYEWFTYGARTRLMPGGKVAIVQTRWHQDDLTGRVIKDMTQNAESDQYEVVEFPAILEIEDKVTHEIVLKPLWPEFFDLEALGRTKASMPTFQWNAQYQQNPTGEEAAIVKREWWNTWKLEEPPECEFIIMSLDSAAETNNRADYTALTTWGVFMYEPAEAYNIILLNSIKKRLEFPELKELALEEYKKREPDSFIVEKKSSGVALYQEMRRMGIPVQEYTPHRGSGDKMARLNSVSDIISSGLVWVPETRWAEELVEEIAGFPFMSNDDLVDSSVMALMRFRQGGFIRLPSDERDEPTYQKRRTTGYY